MAILVRSVVFASLLRHVFQVVFQVVGLEWFAQRQLLGMSDAQVFAELDDGGEGFDGEVNFGVEISEVRKLHSQTFVHRREVKEGVGRYCALVKGLASVKQPFVFHWPP